MITIGLPAPNNARERGRQAACQSHLKQVITAAHMDAQDYRGLMGQAIIWWGNAAGNNQWNATGPANLTNQPWCAAMIYR
jgi:hypothetical protein